jgi:protein tyrosine phosphatase (PTP) superfamily phosphohydrolase (DUF442 family)
MKRDLFVVSAGVSAGVLPTQAALRSLAMAGYCSVLAVRSESGEGSKVLADGDRQLAQQLGMSYAVVPVSSPEPTPSEVERFRLTLASLPHPAYVVGTDRELAVALATIHVALRHGIAEDEMLARVRNEGALTTPDLLDFVSGYISYHRHEATHGAPSSLGAERVRRVEVEQQPRPTSLQAIEYRGLETEEHPQLDRRAPELQAVEAASTQEAERLPGAAPGSEATRTDRSDEERQRDPNSLEVHPPGESADPDVDRPAGQEDT